MISTFPSILVLVSNLSMEGVVLMKIKTFLETLPLHAKINPSIVKKPAAGENFVKLARHK